MGDNLNAAVSSRAVAGDAMALTSGERTTLAASIWNALTSGMSTVGSIGKKLADWTIGTAQTGDSYARLGAPAGASVSADIAAAKVDTAAIKAKTDNLPSDPADASDVASSFSTVNSTLSTIAGYVDTEVAAIKAKTDLIPASPAAVGSAMTLTSAYDAAKTAAQPADVPTANANADALLDRSNGIETSWTLRQAMRIILATVGGKFSGAATTTATMRDVGDTKNRVVATVDVDGNRTSITYDKT